MHRIRNVDRRGKRIGGQYIGTRPHRKRWRAVIKFDGENKDLGSFYTEEDAARAYDACCRYHYGGFAVCNFEGDEAYSVDEARSRARSRIAVQSSQYVGVRWFIHAEKWHVAITQHGTQYSLGHYDDEVEAAKAYDTCARYFFGALARTNFPKGDCLSPNELYRRYLRNHFDAGKRTSAYEGVFQSGTRWRSAIVIDGRQTKVGAFSTEEEAARAYDACVRFYRPFGSFTNFEGTEALSIEHFRRRKSKPGTSKFRGVKWHKSSGRWMSNLNVNNHRIYVGSFKVEEDAARAYDDARAAHGLPRVNFPDELQAA
jgi:hypothetical protein